jgi:CBS domain-containing protein
MAEVPAHVDEADSIVIAAERMLDEGVRHLPVMSDGRTLGVVSVRDVLRVFTDEWRRSSPHT